MTNLDFSPFGPPENNRPATHFSPTADKNLREMEQLYEMSLEMAKLQAISQEMFKHHVSWIRGHLINESFQQLIGSLYSDNFDNNNDRVRLTGLSNEQKEIGDFVEVDVQNIFGDVRLVRYFMAEGAGISLSPLEIASAYDYDIFKHEKFSSSLSALGNYIAERCPGALGPEDFIIPKFNKLFVSSPEFHCDYSNVELETTFIVNRFRDNELAFAAYSSKKHYSIDLSLWKYPCVKLEKLGEVAFEEQKILAKTEDVRQGELMGITVYTDGDLALTLHEADPGKGSIKCFGRDYSLISAYRTRPATNVDLQYVTRRSYDFAQWVEARYLELL